MPVTISEIPSGVQIVEEGGEINLFFRLRWEEVRALAQAAASIAQQVYPGTQNAAIPTTAAYTTPNGGAFRISYYLRKTVADGVASSLTFTYHWTESGVPLSESAAALVTDTTTAQQSGAKVVNADANTDLAFAVAYTSTTPGAMKFLLTVTVEWLR